MSRFIWILTLGLLGLPFIILMGAGFRNSPLIAPAVLLMVIYAWVWLRFRPRRFVVHAGALEIIWPCKCRRIPRANISMVRLMDHDALHREIGWGVRVGAGGLWGGFGWLWTQRRGIVQMYVSRTDRYVWIEPVVGRPWLITPEQPEAFVCELKTA